MSEQHNGPLARLSGVEKTIEGSQDLRGIDLELRPGELVVLIGPRGSGKTAIFNLLFGLYRPDSGEVEVFGRNPREQTVREQLGAMPQTTTLPAGLNVGEILDLARVHFPDPAPRDELVRRFHLNNLRETRSGSLDTGERLWLATALAFVGKPKAVLLDMPISGMQIEWQHMFWDIIQDYIGSGGTVLMSMNRTDHVERHASRFLVVAQGKIVAAGDGDYIMDRAGMDRGGDLGDAILRLTKET